MHGLNARINALAATDHLISMGLSYSWLLYTGLKILRQWIVPTRAHHQLLVYTVKLQFVTLVNRMQVPGS